LDLFVQRGGLKAALKLLACRLSLWPSTEKKEKTKKKKKEKEKKKERREERKVRNF